MTKVIRLTESDLTRIVKKVIKEQRDMKNQMILTNCYPKKLLKYEPQSEMYYIDNNLLDELEEATSSFSSGSFSNWDEERIVKALETSTKENAKLVQDVLKCALPKMGFGKLYDNNPLLTICKIAFTSIIGTDFGDSRLKTRAQKALNRLGINAKI